jgi:hypothetical protein
VVAIVENKPLMLTANEKAAMKPNSCLMSVVFSHLKHYQTRRKIDPLQDRIVAKIDRKLSIVLVQFVQGHHTGAARTFDFQHAMIPALARLGVLKCVSHDCAAW